MLDEATGEGDDKQFYTITTEAGNVFYLIIDGKRDDNNVYFLNDVTEADLMALAEKNEGTMSVIPTEDVCTCTDKCEAGEVNTACSVCKNDLKGCTGKERPAETEELAQTEPPKKDNGSAGTIIFIIVALLAVGGVGYYVKIVRPKLSAYSADKRCPRNCCAHPSFHQNCKQGRCKAPAHNNAVRQTLHIDRPARSLLSVPAKMRTPG